MWWWWCWWWWGNVGTEADTPPLLYTSTWVSELPVWLPLLPCLLTNTHYWRLLFLSLTSAATSLSQTSSGYLKLLSTVSLSNAFRFFDWRLTNSLLSSSQTSSIALTDTCFNIIQWPFTPISLLCSFLWYYREGSFAFWCICFHTLVAQNINERQS